jgi:choline-sulfatase
MGDRRATSDYGIIQRAIEIIERKESDKPFCLFLPIFSRIRPIAPRRFSGDVQARRHSRPDPAGPAEQARLS